MLLQGNYSVKMKLRCLSCKAVTFELVVLSEVGEQYLLFIFLLFLPRFSSPRNLVTHFLIWYHCCSLEDHQTTSEQIFNL